MFNGLLIRNASDDKGRSCCFRYGWKMCQGVAASDLGENIIGSVCENKRNKEGWRPWYTTTL